MVDDHTIIKHIEALCFLSFSEHIHGVAGDLGFIIPDNGIAKQFKSRVKGRVVEAVTYRLQGIIEYPYMMEGQEIPDGRIRP